MWLLLILISLVLAKGQLKPDPLPTVKSFELYAHESARFEELVKGIKVKKGCRVEVGKASWYGPKFHGRKTANGEVFDLRKFTAASRTLPLGSYVLVVNLENGRRVVVRINDRGPFVGGRIIDLSQASADKLGMIKKGVSRVAVIPLECLSYTTQKRLYDELVADILRTY
ncbi:MAG: septal ring lytic transglycosylase RlpA family protein [Aquificae bacterium]|nr:septal ring lytic transglycosylase RlpA family protein [Aquificota bacterium]